MGENQRFGHPEYSFPSQGDIIGKPFICNVAAHALREGQGPRCNVDYLYHTKKTALVWCTSKVGHIIILQIIARLFFSKTQHLNSGLRQTANLSFTRQFFFYDSLRVYSHNHRLPVFSLSKMSLELGDESFSLLRLTENFRHSFNIFMKILTTCIPHKISNHACRCLHRPVVKPVNFYLCR